jgi:FixJ family two-component response regulator/ribonuclease BN (tRNA processing enzyme)
MSTFIGILIVDDDDDFLKSQKRLFEQRGFIVLCADSEFSARSALINHHADLDVALIDMDMEASDSGLKIVELIATKYPRIASVVLTGKGGVENAVLSMQAGAFNYVLKGETSSQTILDVVGRAFRQQEQLRNVKSGFDDASCVLRNLTLNLHNVREAFYRVEAELDQPTSSSTFSDHAQSMSTRHDERSQFSQQVDDARNIIKEPDLFTRCVDTNKNSSFKTSQLCFLRRWNSHTPCLFDVWGGGYFLSWKGKGTIVDPGASFLRLFEQHTPYGLKDIDMVVVTHDHVDHCQDLAPMISLLRAYNSCGDSVLNGKKHWDIMVSPGVAAQYDSLLNNTETRDFLHRQVVNRPQKVESTDQPGSFNSRYQYGFLALPAFHKELLGEDSSMGCRFDLDEAGGSIVISSDTRIAEDPKNSDGSGLVKGYTGASLLVLHVGTMEKPDQKILPQHLGMNGVVEVLTKLINNPPKLVVLTEWGYEFGRLGLKGRSAFCRLVAQKIGPPYYAAVEGEVRGDASVPILPADIGLRISLPDLDIWIPDTEDGHFAPRLEVQALERIDRIEYIWRK